MEDPNDSKGKWTPSFNAVPFIFFNFTQKKNYSPTTVHEVGHSLDLIIHIIYDMHVKLELFQREHVQLVE